LVIEEDSMTVRHAFPYLLFLLVAPVSLVLAPAARERAEVARIQAHIARAERLARSHDVSGLSPSQRDARERNLARLEAYRQRGAFPHNDDFADRRVPYFVDRAGTPCAMAYLIEQSGRSDLVERVVRRSNNATVLQLAADAAIGPALAAWLGEAGLSVQEAQTIQPQYGGDIYPPPSRGDVVPSAYAAASATLGTLNVLSFALNTGAISPKPSPWVARAGVLTGLAEIGLGAAHLGATRHSAALGWANILVGTASAVASTTSLVRSSRQEVASRGLRLAPLYGLDDGARPFAGVGATF
jgi:hypothetical protein